MVIFMKAISLFATFLFMAIGPLTNHVFCSETAVQTDELTQRRGSENLRWKIPSYPLMIEDLKVKSILPVVDIENYSSSPVSADLREKSAETHITSTLTFPTRITTSFPYPFSRILSRLSPKTETDYSGVVFPIAGYQRNGKEHVAVSLVTFTKLEGALGLVIEREGKKSDGYVFLANSYYTYYVSKGYMFSTDYLVHSFEKLFCPREYLESERRNISIEKTWLIREFYAQKIEQEISDPLRLAYTENTKITGKLLYNDWDEQVEIHNDATYIEKILKNAAYIKGLDEKPFSTTRSRRDLICVAQNSSFSLDSGVYAEVGGNANLGCVSSNVYKGYSWFHKRFFGEQM